MFDTISFSLPHLPCPAAGPSTRVLTPVPVVNGHPFFGDHAPTTDTLGLLLASLSEDEFDLCTCSCGEAACAGFQECVEVARPEGLVVWRIPLYGYERLVDHVTFGPGPWTFKFERKAYEAALADLQARVIAAQQANPCLEYSPYDPRDDDEPVGQLASALARWRARQALPQV